METRKLMQKPEQQHWSASRFSRALAFELALWHLPALVFLFYYVSAYTAPLSAITANLGLMFDAFLGLSGLRILVHIFSPSRRLSKWMGSMLLSVSLFLISSYFLLCGAGLEYWGRIPSAEILQSYTIKQLGGLLQALGLAWWQPLALISGAFVATVLLIWKLHDSNDWTASTPARMGSLSWSLVGFGLLLISFAKFVDFSGDPPISAREPFALTLFPGRFANTMQGLSIDAGTSKKNDDIADSARNAYTVNQNRSGRNVVLFVVDGLRPDRMGALGAPRDTTPFLSKIDQKRQIGLKGSIHSVCAESACGLLALSSARFPNQFSQYPFTLYEVLKRHGYRIIMLLSGDHTNFYGLRRFYGKVDFFRDGNDSPDRYINDDMQLLDFVDELPAWSGSPVMIQFHLMSVHNLGKRWLDELPFQPSQPYALGRSNTEKESRNFYDNGVFHSDEMIRLLIERLKTKGYMEDALVAITSDHGEALGEHGQWSHANSLHDPTVRIPFIVVPRWGKSVKHTSAVGSGSIVDVGPTLLDLLGMNRPDSWSGVPLQETRRERIIYLRQGLQAGLVDFRQPTTWKYWVNISTGGEYVFNLDADPLEKNNLIDEISPDLLGEWRLATLPSVGTINTRTSD